jgi:hypothetical protein
MIEILERFRVCLRDIPGFEMSCMVHHDRCIPTCVQVPHLIVMAFPHVPKVPFLEMPGDHSQKLDFLRQDSIFESFYITGNLPRFLQGDRAMIDPMLVKAADLTPVQ